MNKKNLIPFLFISSFVIIIVGTLLKILHQPFGELILIIGVACAISYSVLCLFEIFSCNRIDTSEKIMWIVGFLFFNTIAGLIYILSVRKRILRDYKLNI